MPTVRECLQQILSAPDQDLALTSHAYSGLDEQDEAWARQHQMQSARGKVRDLLWQDNHLFLLHSDRLSAFDRPIGLVPYRGVMLAAITSAWQLRAAKILPQPKSQQIAPRIIQTQRMRPFPIEVVVRGYLAGSMLRSYQAGERQFCGVDLPDGLTDFGALPTPIITPTTKAAAYVHDENTTAEELISKGACSREQWNTIAESALKLFALGQEVYRDLGWILVDTKYEFGVDAQDCVMVIDEIHTPDSSRLWVSKSYAERLQRGDEPMMLDKENVRRYLLSQGFSGHGPVPIVPSELLIQLAHTYLDVAERLTGQVLQVDSPGSKPNLQDLPI